MATNIDVTMQDLVCKTTTEMGHDEFYYFLAASIRDQAGVAVGTPIGLRGPTAAQGADADNATAWDMNDDGSNLSNLTMRQPSGAVMATMTLQPNQTALIGLMFMESDNSKTDQDIVKASATIGGAAAGFAFGGPIGGLIGGVVGALSVFLPINADDHLGACSFQVFCHADGSAWVTQMGFWSPNTKVWAQSVDGVPPYSTQLHLYGDGCNYYPVIRIDGVQKQPGSLVNPY